MKAPVIEKIYIKRHLDEHWLRRFEGVQITLRPEGVTEISSVMDQAALHGMLNHIRDLGMTLFSISGTGRRKICQASIKPKPSGHACNTAVRQVHIRYFIHNKGIL